MLTTALAWQNTQTFCSVAAAVTVLNALTTQGLPGALRTGRAASVAQRVCVCVALTHSTLTHSITHRTPALTLAALAPVAAAYAPYPYYTQENIWQFPCVSNVTTHLGGKLSARFVAAAGATLAEWASYVNCFAPTQRTHAADSSLAAFRSQLVGAFNATPTRFVALNYLRSEVGQLGGGHMSPLAAYDRLGDRALVLDVARYRYAPVWVPLQTLFQAMRGVDSDSGLSRGWIEVRLQSTAVLPAGPAPPAAVNFTSSRACLASLPTAADVDAVVACMRSGVGPVQSPPPPATACPAAGGGFAGTLALIFAMSTCFLAISLQKYRREEKERLAAAMERPQGTAHVQLRVTEDRERLIPVHAPPHEGALNG